MSDVLYDRLQSSLGSTYVLERELGGGGMSRVFLAEEVRFRRRVVVKVLAPELAAGVLVDRFEREVSLAARLQDPHIVPVLSAGEVDGLPFYTMPYVAGPSLRTRLRDPSGTGGPIDVASAMTILRDVALALSYAHSQGVVHRDIKPENVLLAGDTAVVTDFGIAKALALSTTLADAVDRTSEMALTGLGTSLGTPAYMAPEQAAGEPVDVRADLYAWGIVAYELLSGAHPFAGKTTAPQLIAAQISETPAPLARAAPGVPLALAELVTRCLAKDPAGRPATAAELVATLRAPFEETAGNPSTREQINTAVGQGRSTRSFIVGGATIALIGLIAGAWYLAPEDIRLSLMTLVRRAPPALRVNRVVVAPFEDRTGDPKLAALGSMAADQVAEALSRLGSLEVVDARTAAWTGEVVRGIPRLLRTSDERALGEESGARVVVAGTYYVEGDSIHFRTRILDAETGAIRTSLNPVTAPVRSPGAAVAGVTARVVAALRAASDEDADYLSGFSSPPSLAAYAAFRDGRQAFLRPHQSDSSWLEPLLRAIALDSTYAAPVLTLAYFSSIQHRFDTSDSALVRARRFQGRLTRGEEALLDLVESAARGDVRAALEAARHTGVPLLVARPGLDARRPRAAIEALIASDPDRGLNIPLAESYWESLVVAYAQLGDYSAAARAVHEGERRVGRLRGRAFDVMLAAARGDVAAVDKGLEMRSRAGELTAGIAARATTLLRTRGGHEAEGRALAVRWADRLVAPRVLDTLTFDPTASTSSAEGALAEGVTDLLVAAERWPDVLRAVDAWEVRAGKDSASGRTDGYSLNGRRYHLQRRRAAALVHVGRRAESLALDSLWARTTGARWDYGQSALARAGLAVQLGETDRALRLLASAADEGALGCYWWTLYTRGLATVDGDPLFLPLRSDPRFQALARPDPADQR